MRRQRSLNWPGLVAVLLVVGTFGVLGVIAFGLIWKRPAGPLSTEEVTALSVILGTALGAVGTYLGMAVPNRSDRRQTVTEDQGSEVITESGEAAPGGDDPEASWEAPGAEPEPDPEPEPGAMAETHTPDASAEGYTDGS